MRSAKVVPLGCSRPLQRAIVDFAADQSFAQARIKLQEHYGLEIGESTIQRVTLAHAKAMFEAVAGFWIFPKRRASQADRRQTDGGMIPIVEPDREGKDKRKGKTLSWREAKISLAHAKGAERRSTRARSRAGSKTPGDGCFACAVRAGFGANSHVHAVGDGAPWIVGQMEQQFGDQGSYLIDFYHVCEYLAAAKAIAPDPAARDAWMDTQKEALKAGRLDASCGRSRDTANLPKQTTIKRPCEPAIAIKALAPTS